MPRKESWPEHDEDEDKDVVEGDERKEEEDEEDEEEDGCRRARGMDASPARYLGE